jgi:glycerophosphoryl diester phosphodiesterase
MLIIGHRGARGLAEENTLDSIKAALAAGVDGTEIDIRVTSDGVIVLSHDPFIKDDTAAQWTISQHTYEFLHNRHRSLTTLEQALSVIPSTCQLRIEIKPGEPVAPLGALLRPVIAQRQLYVVSFDYASLRELHATFPDLPLILNEKWSSIRARYRAGKLGTKRVQMNQRWLWHGFLKAVKHGGYLITPYTVNSPRQARRWTPYVEAIITDYPDRFPRERTNT